MANASARLRTSGPFWYVPAAGATDHAVAVRRYARSAVLRRWPRALRPFAALAGTFFFVKEVWTAPPLFLVDAPEPSRTPAYRRRLRWVCLRHGIIPFYAHILGIARQNAYPADCFVQPNEFSKTLEALTAPDTAALLGDKAAFSEFCAAQGVRTPRILALYRDGLPIIELPDGADAEVDLYVKPVRGSQGLGITRWCVKDGLFHPMRDPVGGEEPQKLPPVDRAGLLSELAQDSRTQAHGILVQTAVREHPTLSPVANTAPPQVRLTTGRTRTGQTEVLTASLMVPGPNRAISQFAPCRLVDAPTGAVLENTMSPTPEMPAILSDAPELDGFVLPDWEDAKAAAMRLHKALSGQAPVVAWDLILSPDGPEFLEGNIGTAPLLEQIVETRPPAEGAFTRIVSEYLA